MRIVLSSGHGTKIRGAAGSPIPPQCDEVDEAIKVLNRTADVLREMGHDVETYTDTVSTDQGSNLDRIVDFHNAQGPHDLDVSIHFNAYDGNAHGCEVLYTSSAGLAYARDIVDAICDASGLTNRGPKERNDLAFLNGTAETAVLIETAFCDNTSDCQTYRAKFDDICAAIAEGITGEAASAPPDRPDRPDRPERPPPDIDWPPQPPGTMPPDGALPPISSRRTLRNGMNGPDVRALQLVIGTQADGWFGSITETQVEALQAASDLDATGIVDSRTWAAVDHLYRNMRTGSEGLTDEVTREIVETAENSPLQEYSWPDRGRAAPGYLPGMALSYGAALQRLREDDRAVTVMAAANDGEPDTDALVWYEDELAALGCDSDNDGVGTLRTLFVLMIGLGVRESSGEYYCGRDMSADNVESDTCEAGLFQTSWNIASADPSLPPLLDQFWEDPTGFHKEFREGISPGANDLDCYGSGDGATYQWLAKYSPLFAVLTTGVGLRKRRQHWGPVNRKEVTLKREAVQLLKDVERLVLGA